MTSAATPSPLPSHGEQLVRTLYSAAQRFAQQAAGHLADDRPDDCMAKAGIALEYLVKAYLVKEHPLLVVASPGGQLDIEGMRWAVRNQPQAAAKSRSITANEAVRRCSALIPALDSRSLQLVLAARNGALHLGTSSTDADSVIASVATAADLILPEINHDSRGFWGHYHDAVRGRLDVKRTQVAHTVADRIARANDDWEITFKRLGVEGSNALHAAALKYVHTEDELFEDCPICGAQAVLSGYLQVEEEPEVDHDGDDWYVSHVSLVPFLEPDSLRCNACGFWLDGVEELDAAGIDAGRRESDIEIDYRSYYGEA